MLAQLWHDIRYRVRALLFRKALDEDLQDEVDAHIAREADRLIRQGIPAPEAWRQARIAFGGIEAIKTATRDAWGTTLLESLGLDIREALRGLRTSLPFSMAVTLALAVGIGSTTATFIALRTVTHDPLPWPDDERLVTIWIVPTDDPARTLAPTVPEFIAWRDDSRLFESMGTASLVESHLADASSDETGLPPEEIVVEVSSAGLLETLGITPLLGRVFTAAEDSRDAAPAVALIGRGLWQRRFAARPDIIGRTMSLDGIETRIIGVVPDGVNLVHHAVDVWAPVKLASEQLTGSARGWPVFARLKEGVSLAEANTEVNAIAARPGSQPGGAPVLGARVESLRQWRFGPFVEVLRRFEILSAALFIAACANLAGLLLMRAVARRSALAIRSAIGAHRGRLLRQFLIESLMLTTVGAVGAIGVVWALLRWSSHIGPVPLPHATGTPFDMAGLLFVAAAAVLAALFAIPPAAIHVARVTPADALPTTRSRAIERPGARRLRTGLVAAQVALATVLLVGVGLLAMTFVRIDHQPLGGDPRQIVTVTIRFPPADYRTFTGSHDGLPRMTVSPVPADATERLRQRLEQATGVTSVAVATRRPFAGDYAPVPFDAVGARTLSGHAPIRIVSPAFFETMRIPLLGGRDFTGDDGRGARGVAIVNETMARQVWGGEPALGRTLHVRHAPGDQPREVVGIVGDTRPHPLATESGPAIYLPLEQQPETAVAPRLAERLMMTFLIRTTGDPMAVVPAVQPLVARVDPTRTVDTFQPLEPALTGALAPRRHLLNVLGVFAATVLVLAGVGIHGAVVHGMAQQSREIDIRRAFGAGRGDLWRMTLGRLGWLLAPGIAIGIVVAIGSSPVIANLLWGVSATHPPTYAAAALLVCALAVAVASGPVRRALSTSPHAALNDE